MRAITREDTIGRGPAGALPTVRVQPTRGWVSLRLGELIAYRELLYFLVWRDVKVRYKQTALGAAWAVIQPVMTMLVFSLFFGKLGKIPSDGIPYPIFSFCALVPWTLFVNGLTQGANSLVASSNLVRKVYFPRLAIPLATVLAGTVDFAIAFAVLVVLMLGYGLVPTENAVWLPVFLLLALMTSMGVSTWLAALNAKYRDVRHALPFITQLWLFATPIAYPSSLLRGPWHTVYGLNPMAGVVEGFRWAMLGTNSLPWQMLGVSTAVSLALLVSGAFYFRRTEKTFADVL